MSGAWRMASKLFHALGMKESHQLLNIRFLNSNGQRRVLEKKKKIEKKFCLILFLKSVLFYEILEFSVH